MERPTKEIKLKPFSNIDPEIQMVNEFSGDYSIATNSINVNARARRNTSVLQ